MRDHAQWVEHKDFTQIDPLQTDGVYTLIALFDRGTIIAGSTMVVARYSACTQAAGSQGIPELPLRTLARCLSADPPLVSPAYYARGPLS